MNNYCYIIEPLFCGSQKASLSTIYDGKSVDKSWIPSKETGDDLHLWKLCIKAALSEMHLISELYGVTVEVRTARGQGKESHVCQASK